MYIFKDFFYSENKLEIFSQKNCKNYGFSDIDICHNQKFSASTSKKHEFDDFSTCITPDISKWVDFSLRTISKKISKNIQKRGVKGKFSKIKKN